MASEVIEVTLHLTVQNNSAHSLKEMDEEKVEKGKSFDDILDIVGQGWWFTPFYFLTTLAYAVYGVASIEVDYLASLDEEMTNFNDSSLLAGKIGENHSISFIQEFDLGSSRQYLRSIYQMMFSIGGMIGCFGIAITSNRYGYQKSIWSGSLLLLLMTILTITVESLEALMVFRLLTGIGFVMIFRPSISMGIECCTPSSRATFGFVTGLGFPLMLVVIPLFSYMYKDWRTIHLFGSVPIFLHLLFANPLVLKESPRWLVLKGRIQEASQVLRRAAKINGRTYSLPEDLEDTLHQIYASSTSSKCEEGGSSSSSVMSILRSLFSTKPMRILSVVCVLNAIIIGSLFIGLALRTKISASPDIFLIVLGFAEVPACTIIIPITQRFGRRNVYCALSVVFAVLELLMMTLILLQRDSVWAIILFSGIAYMLTDGMIMINHVYTSEVFPTSVRSFATNINFAMVCVGFNLPPLLEIVLPVQYFSWLSLLVYSAISVLGGVLVLQLPETNNCPLYQTVEEMIKDNENKESK